MMRVVHPKGAFPMRPWTEYVVYRDDVEVQRGRYGVWVWLKMLWIMQ